MQRDKRGRFVKKADAGTSLSLNNPSGGGVPTSLNLGTAKKIRYNYKDGLIIDEYGNVLSIQDASNASKYQRDYTLQVTPNFLGNISTTPTSSTVTTPVTSTTDTGTTEDSNGMNIIENPNSSSDKGKFWKPLDRTKMADFLEYARAGVGAAIN